MGLKQNIMALLGRGASSLPALVDVAQKPRPRSEFMRGGRGVTMNSWRPALREIQTDIANSWEDAAARTIDLSQNSGWISGMFDQAVANTVGTGLRLRYMPENELFGMSEEQAQELRKLVDSRFELWANDPVECDIEGRRSFYEAQDPQFRTWLATGEMLAELPYRKRFGSNIGTKFRLVPPHRIVNRTDPSRRIASGVIMDQDLFPVGYVTRRIDPIYGSVEIEVPARDRIGRPRVIHIFSGLPGQVRGITPLVPALKVARQFDQLADATLLGSIIQTVFAASITSDEPTEEVLAGLMSPQEQARLASSGMSPFDGWFEAQAGWYDANSIDVGMGGRIAHLFPGQKMEFHSPTHPVSSYKDFSLHLLRELARCLGMSYESATGDYANASYSSVRMSVNEIFPITMARRKFIVARFCQPIFEAWLEEQIELGLIPFPGGIENFLANRAAACRAEWRGSPKPQADDLKTAKAHQTYRDMGVITDEVIANDLGLDIEDVYAQRAREKALREQYGLPETDAAGMAELSRQTDKLVNDGGSNGN